MLGELDSAKDRALWATAIYAGLRRGELMALHREDVDLATGVIRVERGWDQEEGEIAPKSAQGRRKVPIPAVLRDRLDAYLVDGPDRAAASSSACARATTAAAAAAEAAGVEPPTLHECRHGYASVMIAAGVNVKALSHLHGPREHPDHARPVRAPAARARRTRPRDCSTPSSPARWATSVAPPTAPHAAQSRSQSGYGLDVLHLTASLPASALDRRRGGCRRTAAMHGRRKREPTANRLSPHRAKRQRAGARGELAILLAWASSQPAAVTAFIRCRRGRRRTRAARTIKIPI